MAKLKTTFNKLIKFTGTIVPVNSYKNSLEIN